MSAPRGRRAWSGKRSPAAVSAGLALAVLLTSPPVRAEGQRAVFALVLGVNRGADRDLGPLRYADDDAARYFDLFRSLGARVYLLSRLDENTRRIHAQAAAEADLPRGAELDRALARLQADIRQARSRRLRTILHVVYAGHGRVQGERGYLTLEDSSIDGAYLRRAFDRLGAEETHLIVDACNSFFLARSRGPGGERRELRGFSALGEAFEPGRVGLLLSTTTATESHEWEGFQAGVFSHEVRSGLYGAADADGDGQVSYREIAAFVERANEAIPNERFRPRVFARAPRSTSILLDLRRVSRRIVVDGEHSAHYLLEDQRGVRLADFHNDRGQRVQLVRPASGGQLYLRDLLRDREYAVPAGPQRVSLAGLRPAAPTVLVRGAAHHAFSLTFKLPFSRDVVSEFRMEALVLAESGPKSRGRSAWRRPLGWSSVALGGAALVSGLALSLSARQLSRAEPAGASHLELSERNDTIGRCNLAAGVMYGLGGAALVAGLVALLWPDRDRRQPPAALVVGGTGIGVGGKF